MKDFHERYMRYANYKERIDLDALGADTAPASLVTYRGTRAARRIYPALYQPRVPLQPPWQPAGVWQRYGNAARSVSFQAREALGEARAALGRVGR